MVSLTITVRPGLRGWGGTGRERNGSFQMTERKATETKLLCGMRSHTCQPARSPSVGTVCVLAAGPNEGQGQEVVQGCLW